MVDESVPRYPGPLALAQSLFVFVLSGDLAAPKDAAQP